MRLVVYFTSAERRVLRWLRGALRTESAFAADDDGLAGFRQYLAKRSGAVVSLVVDVAGEEFHEEQIPWLRGNDREVIVQRRLAQRFADARLATAWSLGRIDGERRNERLLLASYSNARQFEPWLDALEASRARLAGIHSSAQFAPALAGGRDPRCIVVCAHASGLRESFLERGRLRFARFENVQPGSADAYASRAAEQLERLVQYLTAQRALPADRGPLPVVVIAREAQRAAFERVLAVDARYALRFESLADAARRLGLKAAAPDLDAEQLALALAATRPMREQFARNQDRRGFIAWRSQRAVLAAGALGFAASAAFAGMQWLGAQELREQGRIQRHAAQDASRRYAHIAATSPVLPARPDDLKAAVREIRRIAGRSAVPEPALAHVAVALERCPEVKLDALTWGVRTQAVAESSANPAQVLEITAHIAAVQRPDRRAIGARIQCLADALQSGSGWQIARSQLPFDLSSGGTLTGGAGESDAPPHFVIVVSRPLG